MEKNFSPKRSPAGGLKVGNQPLFIPNQKTTRDPYKRYIQELIFSNCVNSDFHYIQPVYFYFMVIWIYCNCYLIHQNLVFQPPIYKFIVLGPLGLDPLHFLVQDSNRVLTMYIHIILLKLSTKYLLMFYPGPS